MGTWYEVTAKFIAINENGNEKKVTEQFLLDAISCTDAETRITKELEFKISGQFDVVKIAQTKISEIIPAENGERWFKAKVSFITIDEVSGKEKRVNQYVLCYAESVDNADKNIKDAMHGMMCDFVITSISESKIIDVLPLEKELNV